MPALSDNSRSAYNPEENAHIPFKVVYRAVPAQNGRRWTTIRDLEKKANFVEYDLTQAGFNIATPVRFIPQFGGKTARIEVTGFTTATSLENRPNVPATDTVNRMATGVVPGEKTALTSGDPGGGNLSLGQEPTAQIDSDVLALLDALDAASSTIQTLTLDSLEYNGIKFGRRARTFPNELGSII